MVRSTIKLAGPSFIVPSAYDCLFTTMQVDAPVSFSPTPAREKGEHLTAEFPLELETTLS
ncbi:hypothetical protein CQY20_28225 [Mycolicibacterium agri]|uniref:Uncharacterized protein n=1 Tax=Mycolicibacterium agri TaxID=36811 RepID=A0A2A7MRZ2_MYCAG|nr:hypothetical protein CQY20_28225 [Mycolicibacterium agri]